MTRISVIFTDKSKFGLFSSLLGFITESQSNQRHHRQGFSQELAGSPLRSHSHVFPSWFPIALRSSPLPAPLSRNSGRSRVPCHPDRVARLQSLFVPRESAPGAA